MCVHADPDAVDGFRKKRHTVSHGHDNINRCHEAPQALWDARNRGREAVGQGKVDRDDREGIQDHEYRDEHVNYF